MTLLRSIWASVVCPPAPKVKLPPRDRFKLVRFDGPRECRGWEAHQWHGDEAGEVGEWRPLMIACGDFGVYWADTRSPDKHSAELAIEDARDNLRTCVVTEHPA